MADVVKKEPGPEDRKKQLIASAKKLILQAHDALCEETPKGAAWRLADALDYLKRYFEITGDKDVIGVHVPTGLGSILGSGTPLVSTVEIISKKNA